LSIAELRATGRLLLGRKPWPVEQVDATDSLPTSTLGLVAVQLALTFPTWVRRRRFGISYVDDTTIRQRMSVDFALPEPAEFWATGPSPAPGDTVYVPLHILRKETLTNFNVFDESGTRLSTLTTQDNGTLAAAGLGALVSGLAHRPPDEKRELRDSITEIVMAPKTPAHDPVERVLKPKLMGLLGQVLDDDEVRALVTDLAAGFLLLVPVEYRPGRDRVVKAEWDGPNFWHGRQETGGIRRTTQSLLASIGWADKQQNIPGLQLGWAQSTHVEVAAPPDVEMTAATLNAVQFEPSDGSTHTPTKTVYDQPRINLNTSPRAKVPPRATPSAAAYAALLRCRGDTGSVDVRFRTPAGGVLLASVVASSVTCALLWTAGGRLAALDAQTSTAVVLVLPIIVAAFLARPGEHVFATRLLVGVRLCALLVGLCSLAVAGVIGLATIERPIEHDVPAQTASCDAQHDRVGGRQLRLRRLDCALPAAEPTTDPPTEANPAARAWVRRLAGVATFFTAVLAVGFVRTWLADVVHRGREDLLTA
jgi:hypothetical protein